MRKFFALLSMIALTLLLVACGSDNDEESEPTAAPLPPTVPAEATEPPPTFDVTPDDALASPATDASPVASPDEEATPVDSAVIPGGSPVATPIASPATDGTPAPGAVAVPGGIGSDVADGMQALRGSVSLPGTINEGFVISDDGCVGLGRYAGIQAGQQVIVRDGQGAIIGVTELAATGSDVVCGWTFEVEAPESDYYAVSIPMVGERVYAGDDVAARDGQIELVLP